MRWLVRVACVEFMFGPLAEHPQRVGKPLRAELAGRHSARRGDFRIICRIDDDQRLVDILHIGRRTDIYHR